MSSTVLKHFHVGRVAQLSPGVLLGALLATALWVYLPVGIYLGGDWTSPATPYQARQFFHPYVWSSSLDFGRPWLLAASGLLYEMFMYFITALGLPVEYFGKTVLTLGIVAAYFFQYQLLRYFKIKEFASIAGGVAYVTTPVFFNYSLMGWPLALLAMALFPLATQWLCKAMRQDNMRYAIGIAFVWALATLQSQSLVWFPLLFMALGIYLVHDRESAKAYLKKLGAIFITFVFLCSYWWIALLLFQDENITSNAIIISSGSIGADGPFTPINALRLWGSLFNFQFESALSRGWAFGAWLLPIAAIVAIIGSKGEKRRLALAMGLLAFMLPAGMLWLKEHREILMMIPGSGLIRQLSRFTVLTSFAYAVLLGISLDLLSKAKRYPIRFVFFPTVAMFAIGVWPWWMGELTNYLNTPPGKDFRLRVKQFPPDYYEVEKLLTEVGLVSRSLYLPYGISASYKDDPEYRGAFKEAVDVFAALSPVPGTLMPSDRPSPIRDYMKFIQNTSNVIAATHFTPTNFYILRKNIETHQIQIKDIFQQTDRYFPSDSFDRIWDSKNISIYLRKNLVPLVYSPQKSRLHGEKVDILDEEATSELVGQGLALIFASQNFGKEVLATRFAVTSKIPDAVEYRKINPTKYRIRLHHARGDLPLLFGESYSHGWRLYPAAYQASEKVVSMAKGYAISPGNERYQANSTEVKKFATQGWISEAGEEFISKRFFGAIQNDNLPEGSLTDTWYSHPLPEERHIKVNGYANGWVVDIEELCADSQSCRRNEDGSFDVELIMEFWPQQIFYLGLTITGLMTLFSIAFLLRPRQRTGSSPEVTL